ncbi:hypothetical protein BH10PSE1_BH10PSE1_23450 [soil metagenome]
MTRFAPVALAAVIVSIAPAIAWSQNGNGQGGGHGQGSGQGGGHQERPGRGGEGGARSGPAGSSAGRGDDRDRQAPGRQERHADQGARLVTHQLGRQDRSVERGRDTVRAVVRETERADGAPAIIRNTRDRVLIAGCPPGLAKKDNGCLPPGQARQLQQQDHSRYDRYDYLWQARNDEYRYQYREGYLYRLTPQGGLLGYLPVLGGALWTGNAWPGQYAYEPVPSYVSRYYGLNDRDAYRYADGVLYGVNPQTQAITQVAALLTGQDWTVGQRMPSGYDVYNVPYDYRDRYRDTPQSLYRYNDGYVYQVDPTTQMVQAVIQLLT